MSVPSYKEIEIPLLLLINSVGGKIKSSDCYKILAKHFELSEQEIISVMSDGTNRPRWNNMVQWARNSLLKNNYIYDAKISGTGIWSLTEIGKEKQDKQGEVLMVMIEGSRELVKR